MKGKQIIFFQNKDYMIVIAMWVTAELFLFGKFGLYFQMEAEKYISEANLILENHHLSQGRYLFYLSTILIIALSFLMKAISMRFTSDSWTDKPS